MNKQIKQVEEFSKAFNLPIGEELPDISTVRLRQRLLWEEAKEAYNELENWQFKPDNLDKILAEHVDLCYVLLGNIITFGLQDKFEAAFDEIHRANLSKLENGKPVLRGDGKVMKGKDYKPADIKSILNEPTGRD